MSAEQVQVGYCTRYRYFLKQPLLCAVISNLNIANIGGRHSKFAENLAESPRL